MKMKYHLPRALSRWVMDYWKDIHRDQRTCQLKRKFDSHRSAGFHLICVPAGGWGWGRRRFRMHRVNQYPVEQCCPKRSREDEYFFTFFLPVKIFNILPSIRRRRRQRQIESLSWWPSVDVSHASWCCHSKQVFVSLCWLQVCCMSSTHHVCAWEKMRVPLTCVQVWADKKEEEEEKTRVELWFDCFICMNPAHPAASELEGQVYFSSKRNHLACAA